MTPFLSDESRAALQRLFAGDAADPAPEPLQRLREIRMLRSALDADEAVLESVRSALDAGTGWSQIAAAAGLAPAAAKWRWQGTDAEIAERHESGRRRSARPSSKPTELPGMSVAEAAEKLGITAQAVYLRVSRGSMVSRTVELDDGRRYKRVFPDGDPGE